MWGSSVSIIPLSNSSAPDRDIVRGPHHSFWKRSFDVFVSSVALLILLPLFALVAVLIKLDSKGPVFFRQERVGQGLQIFVIHKFRTMVGDAHLKGIELTAGADPRMTRMGRILRKLKIDELPQLINVLKGEMSL